MFILTLLPLNTSRHGHPGPREWLQRSVRVAASPRPPESHPVSRSRFPVRLRDTKTFNEHARTRRGATANGAASARPTTDSLSTLAKLILNPIATFSRAGSAVFAAGARPRTSTRTSSPGPFLLAKSGGYPGSWSKDGDRRVAKTHTRPTSDWFRKIDNLLKNQFFF